MNESRAAETEASERRAVRRLDPRVVAKIAAGEMILRALSVAKELMENSIDAGANAIEIEVGETPDTLLAVSDDGCGMSREDLILALEPHATSKLRSEEDLLAVETLGFRGEALPSIGRVSRMEIVTADREGDGLRVRVEGGERRGPEPAGRPRGTTVRVEDLFFNSPVRKRFLKSPEAELRGIVKLTATIALAHPRVAFRLTRQGEPLLNLPPAADVAERLAAVHGPSFLETLLPVEGITPRGEIQGFVGIPEVARPGTQHQTLIVNRRWVTAPWFSAALRQAYGDLLPERRHPFALIFLRLDPTRLDVNVHPTKREVRFLEESALFGDLVRAVREPLERLVPGWNLDPRDPGSGRAAREAPALLSGGPEGRVAERTPELFSRGEASARVFEGAAAGEAAYGDGGGGETGRDSTGVGPPREGPDTRAGSGAAHGLVPIWQLHRRYLFAQTRQGMLVIDQHAAHERILYERALEHLRGMPAATQQLLFPMPVHLDADEMTAWGEFASDLAILGVDAEEFGGRTVLLRGVPPSWERDPAGMFREVLADLAAGRRRDRERSQRVAASFACRSAVRSGQALTLEEMNALVDQLFATGLPHGDPHGRPTFLQVTLEDLDRRFGRSGG